MSVFSSPVVENSVPAKVNAAPDGLDWSSAVMVRSAWFTVSAPST